MTSNGDISALNHDEADYPRSLTNFDFKFTNLFENIITVDLKVASNV